MTRLFTGRHMLAIMLAFFGVVIGVNMLMATLASRTFGGTVVDNSYVASQQFNGWLKEGRAQERLGWRAGLALDSGRLVTVAARDRDSVLTGALVEAVARHPLGRSPDINLTFSERRPGFYVSQAPLPPGRWLVHLQLSVAGRELRQIDNLS